MLTTNFGVFATTFVKYSFNVASDGNTLTWCSKNLKNSSLFS